MNKEKYKIKESTIASKEVKKSIHRKYVLIGVIVVILSLVVIVLLVRNGKYKKALEYLDKGDYAEAYDILEDLGGSRANNKIKESKYNRSKELINNNEFVRALLFLDEIGDYKDSNELIKKIISENEHLKAFVGNVNDEIILGSYEQDNNLKNGKEPLEWIVISKSKEKIVLISKNIIDVKRNGYKDSRLLYKWLNSSFEESTFDEKVYPIIQDITLLSYLDVDQYIKEGADYHFLETQMTEYALTKKINEFYLNEGLYTYWLYDQVEEKEQFYVKTSYNYYSNTGLEKELCGIAILNGVRPVIVLSNNKNNGVKKYNDDFSLLDIDTEELIKQIQKDQDTSSYDSSASRTDRSYNGYSYEERKNQCSQTWGNSWRCKIQQRYNCTSIGYSKYSDCK